MASWYVGSVQYAAITQWAALTSYSIGDIRRQLAAPAVGSERVFRCTTAGVSLGSEPSWTLTKGSTTTEVSGPVWTEVTGNSTYGWAAAAARWTPICTSWSAAGDTVYIASTHDETSNITFQTTGSVSNPLIVISVNPAGSVPPVGADYSAGAQCRTSGANNLVLGWAEGLICYGVRFRAGSAGSAANINLTPLGNNQSGYFRFVDCILDLASNNANCRLNFGDGAGYTTSAHHVELENTVLNFSNASQVVNVNNATVVWKNTPSATTGTVPTTLFGGTVYVCNVKLDGIDLSAMSGNFCNGGGVAQKYDLTNCKLHASMTPVTGSIVNRGFSFTMTNCGSGNTNYKQYKKTMEGVLTEETTIVHSGGASDGTTTVSQKIVTTADCRKFAAFRGLPLVIWNDTTGSAKTITAEAVNDGTTLKNDEFWLEVEYLGDSGFPLASGANSFVANPTTANANVPTSTEVWTTTGLGSPIKQKASVTVTPQQKGFLRVTPCIGKASQTLYVDPKLTVA